MGIKRNLENSVRSRKKKSFLTSIPDRLKEKFGDHKKKACFLKRSQSENKSFWKLKISY